MPLKTMEPAAVKLLVVHCSATQAKMDIGAKEINSWHQSRGFLKIGYHFVIRRDGRVEKGRELYEPGAHAISVNHMSIGICLVGGLDSSDKPENNFTPAQFAALEDLLLFLKGIMPNVTQVIGHRDVRGVKKDCPCFDVKAWIETTQLKKEPQ